MLPFINKLEAATNQTKSTIVHLDFQEQNKFKIYNLSLKKQQQIIPKKWVTTRSSLKNRKQPNQKNSDLIKILNTPPQVGLKMSFIVAYLLNHQTASLAIPQ